MSLNWSIEAEHTDIPWCSCIVPILPLLPGEELRREREHESRCSSYVQLQLHHQTENSILTQVLTCSVEIEKRHHRPPLSQGSAASWSSTGVCAVCGGGIGGVGGRVRGAGLAGADQLLWSP